ncbi:hypothetical protein [Roseomonas populi]|uniref:DUF3606 domain-containing protein n=1 Tax=Roseomonas populi TaxID=3121582 RepID=A0ABT1X559_9PROT|nr:hypothetical protein [Roseomonas pecuniae]MCR0982854.1 hypothetical protein [Roseomonas pecuniae]
MSQSKTNSAPTPAETEALEETIAYLAKRHRVSQAIVREIARKLGSSPERSAIEREIARGKSRR